MRFAFHSGESGLRGLGHIFDETVQREPERIAVIDTSRAGDPRSVTYRALDQICSQVAASALQTGLQKGDRAAIALGNSLEFVLATFGLMRAGVVPALINPRLARDDLAFMIKDCNARLVLTDHFSASAYTEIDFEGDAPQRLHVGDDLGDCEFDQWLRSGDASTSFEHPSGSDIALQLYTSGSTGRPKGVLLPHGGQVQHFTDQRSFYDKIYTKPPVNLIATPLFHKNGTGMLKTVFANGGTAVLMARFDARAFLENIERYDVTTFTAVAAMLNMMLEHDDLLGSTDFSNLDAIMVGAAPSGRVLLDRASEAFQTRLFHMFGTTEAGAVLGHDPERDYTLDSCGKPMPGVTVKLVDPDTGDTHPSMGELLVSGPGVAAGYHNRPDAMTERFRGGWYATGDILSRDDEGYFFFRGRVDDMFVCGGENIYPREVERQLLDHPAIAQAFVGPVPHPVKGQVPAAILVGDEKALSAGSVQEFYRERAPAYGTPRSVFFKNQFPLAPTGKVDVKALQSELLERIEKETAA